MTFIFLCLLLSCCQSSRTDDGQGVSQTDSILFVGDTKKVFMNDLDYPTSGHIRYYEEDGRRYLIQGNEGQKTIRVYDYASGKKLSEAELSVGEGELFAHHPDTTFVIDRSPGKAGINALVGGKNVMFDIPVRVKKGHIEQYPRCRTNGAVYVDGKWYFSCFRIGEYPDEMKLGKERFPLLEVDLEKKDYRFVGAYPDLYAFNNMGTLNYWVPELCRGKNDEEILIGFRASPEMLVYSPATGEYRFESVKSVYADTIPLPLTEKGRDYFSNSDSYYYYAQYSHYGPISYDPWKKIYYRFVGIGLNDWNLESHPLLQTRKKWSVMVFDTAFRKLGEQYLGDAYHVDNHFVSPDGLFLLNKGKDEDVAEYTLFKYKKE